MNDTKFAEIPAAACQFEAHIEADMSRNGEDSKTVPVRMLARSSKPIEHFYWGKVIHDISGLVPHKSKIPIDYAHNNNEVLGYLNHFEDTAEGKVASGALVPFADGDRASEVIHKMKNGVPYEASINFGGDGIVIEEVGENETVIVNGISFSGGVVIRSAPLRGVAIVPYGADQNTETSFSAHKTYKGILMDKDLPTVEAEVVEEVTVEATETEVFTQTDSRAEFKQFHTEFGELGTAYFEQGLSYEEAKDTFTAHRSEMVDALQADLDVAREEIAALKAEIAKNELGADPISANMADETEVAVDPNEEVKKLAAQFEKKGLTSGQAFYAAKQKLERK